MSARKIDPPEAFQDITVQTRKSSFTVPAHLVCLRKNGVEFFSASPVTPWTEMTVDVQPPHATKKLRCMGVVVACSGNRHTGYHVSVLFTGLSRQTQERLSLLAYS